MKACFFTLVFVVLSLGVSSQEVAPNILNENEKVQNGTSLRAWYNYAKLISEEAEERSHFSTPIFPDTTVWLEFDNGYDKVAKHSVGQVIDPYAPLFERKELNLDSSRSYHLDSLAIYYRYFRHIDSLPDLLVVQLYRGAKLDLVEDPNWASNCSYASVGYDPILRRGARADKEFTYFLETEDSTGRGEPKVLKFPVEWDMEAGERAAVVMTYFPINPYLTGDTLDPYSSIPLRRKINSFSMFEVRDDEPIIEKGFYNNALIVTPEIRYDANWSFWRKKFKPGTLWASSLGIYHADISFLIRAERPLGDDKPSKDLSELKSVLVNDQSISVEHQGDQFREIRILDLAGRAIPIEHRYIQKNTLTIDLLSSHQGIYILMLDERAIRIFLD